MTPNKHEILDVFNLMRVLIMGYFKKVLILLFLTDKINIFLGI